MEEEEEEEEGELARIDRDTGEDGKQKKRSVF